MICELTRLTILCVEELESEVQCLGVVVSGRLCMMFVRNRFDNENREPGDEATENENAQHDAAHPSADDHASQIYALLLLNLSRPEQPALLSLLQTLHGGSVNVHVALRVIEIRLIVQLHGPPSPFVIHGEMLLSTTTKPNAEWQKICHSRAVASMEGSHFRIPFQTEIIALQHAAPLLRIRGNAQQTITLADYAT